MACVYHRQNHESIMFVKLVTTTHAVLRHLSYIFEVAVIVASQALTEIKFEASASFIHSSQQ